MRKKVNGKKKGSKFELDIAKQIASTIGVEYGKYVRRTPGSGSLLCRADLWVHKDHRYKFAWYLELKKRQTIRLEHLLKPKNELVSWYKEAKEKLQIDPEYDEPLMTPVALVFARNNVSPLILMSYKDFLEMDLHYSYPKTSINIFFTDENKDEYIVLDWNSFLQIYKV